MTFHIKLENGHWTVNGKKLNECDANEFDFIDRFFREVKIKNPHLENTNNPENNSLVRRVYHNN